MRLLPVCCALALAHPLHGQPDSRIAGLASRPGLFLGEGITDTAHHPRAMGTLKAVMLFARFPDAQDEDRTPQEIPGCRLHRPAGRAARESAVPSIRPGRSGHDPSRPVCPAAADVIAELIVAFHEPGVLAEGNRIPVAWGAGS